MRRQKAWLTTSQKAIVRALAKRPREARTKYIVDEVYGERPDGGPTTADNTIKVQVSLMRPLLAEHGIHILTLWGEGYMLEVDPGVDVEAVILAFDRRRARWHEETYQKGGAHAQH